MGARNVPEGVRRKPARRADALEPRWDCDRRARTLEGSAVGAGFDEAAAKAKGGGSPVRCGSAIDSARRSRCGPACARLGAGRRTPAPRDDLSTASADAARKMRGRRRRANQRGMSDDVDRRVDMPAETTVGTEMNADRALRRGAVRRGHNARPTSTRSPALAHRRVVPRVVDAPRDVTRAHELLAALCKRRCTLGGSPRARPRAWPRR